MTAEQHSRDQTYTRTRMNRCRKFVSVIQPTTVNLIIPAGFAGVRLCISRIGAKREPHKSKNDIALISAANRRRRGMTVQIFH